MMGVYIKGMEMPKSCSVCQLMVTVEYEEICSQTGEYVCQYDRADDCPLVLVPTHGRLIDADALINALQELFDKRAREAEFSGNRGACVTWNDAIYHIKSAPTVIPADKEGE